MCGIAGFVIADGDLGKLDPEVMTKILALHMQSRGKDATGILTVSPKGRMKLRKAATAADIFLASRDGVGSRAQTVLIHTRAATKGSPTNPLNNHPIVYDTIYGIHNGMVSNDDDLFQVHGWKRYAQVDSEAIFASLHHKASPKEALEDIDASYAVAWVDTSGDPRTLWIARGWSSPLFYLRTKNGSTIFASTKAAVVDAGSAGGLIEKDKELEKYIIDTKPGTMCVTSADGTWDELTFNGLGTAATYLPGHRKTYTGGYGGYGGWDEEDWMGASGHRTGRTPIGQVGQGKVSNPYKAKEVGSLIKEGAQRHFHSVAEQRWIRQAFLNNEWVEVPAEIDADPVGVETETETFKEGDRVSMKMVPVDQGSARYFSGTVTDVSGTLGLRVDWDPSWVNPDSSGPITLIGQIALKGA